jgi:predicted ribosome quality control (RQC) complex YloA/Tae2 family protein
VSLRPTEFGVLSAALSAALRGAVVQKVTSPAPPRVDLELRTPGRTTRLVVSAETGLARISISALRAAAAGPPSPWLLRLRKELVGARLVGLTRTGAREVEIRFEQGTTPRTLVLEAEAPAGLLLLGDAGRPLASSSGRARPARPPTPLLADEAASRLPVAGDAFALGLAAEALYSTRAASARVAELRRAQVQPLKTRVERLRRTLEKVRGEANRTEAAEEHRRFGELLRQNAAAVPRGAKEVTLTEYSADGQRAVRVPLDPALATKAQAERHFQRYRRLTRGSAHAQRRLEELQVELAEAEAALATARAAPDASLLASAPKVLTSRPSRSTARVHQPYRIFHAHSGEKILVGRAGRDNDALTFAVAKPDDVWLHARGLPGAHVVIPLSRGAEVPKEDLLDAAHLALHHSRGAGADRGEVSYTRAKFVRRVKGGAPGSVTYSREKTFLVRLEPARMERLLASREAP